MFKVVLNVQYEVEVLEIIFCKDIEMHKNRRTNLLRKKTQQYGTTVCLKMIASLKLFKLKKVGQSF